MSSVTEKNLFCRICDGFLGFEFKVAIECRGNDIG
jgi:hypothetical protein